MSNMYDPATEALREQGLITPADTLAVQELKGVGSEERELVTKGVAGYLIDLATDETLHMAAQRVEHLYWRASTVSAPFTHDNVDAFANAVAIALDEHTDKAAAQGIATHMRRSKYAAQNKPLAYQPASAENSEETQQ